MTPEFIRAAIMANPPIRDIAQAPTPDLEAISAALGVVLPREVVQGVEITPRGSAALFPSIGGLPGPLAFQKALRQLTAWAAAAKASQAEEVSLLGEAVEEQLAGYRTRGLDFGVQALRDMLDLIAAQGGLSSQQAAGFKGLAERAARVDELTIKRAIWADDGQRLV
jgi:hypothetical protein